VDKGAAVSGWRRREQKRGGFTPTHLFSFSLLRLLSLSPSISQHTDTHRYTRTHTRIHTYTRTAAPSLWRSPLFQRYPSLSIRPLRPPWLLPYSASSRSLNRMAHYMHRNAERERERGGGERGREEVCVCVCDVYGLLEEDRKEDETPVNACVCLCVL